jgi:hypothetical protein
MDDEAVLMASGSAGGLIAGAFDGGSEDDLDS